LRRGRGAFGCAGGSAAEANTSNNSACRSLVLLRLGAVKSVQNVYFEKNRVFKAGRWGESL
jgi:hypothetical protein